MQKNTNEDYTPVRENLSDAACPSETIERFMALRAEGRLPEQIELLQSHRKALLDKVHAGQRALDCLDYLLFRIKKENGPPAGR